MNTFDITNKQTYINGKDVYQYIKTCDLKTTTNNLSIYTIKNVLFCNVIGVLNIYKDSTGIIKYEFSSIDYLRLFNISNLNFDYYFNMQISQIRRNLDDKYTKIDDNNYFNKLFTFNLNVNNSSFNILIERKNNYG